jgi:hypothetical protein
MTYREAFPNRYRFGRSQRHKWARESGRGARDAQAACRGAAQSEGTAASEWLAGHPRSDVEVMGAEPVGSAWSVRGWQCHRCLLDGASSFGRRSLRYAIEACRKRAHRAESAEEGQGAGTAALTAASTPSNGALDRTRVPRGPDLQADRLARDAGRGGAITG